ncbi:MAG TPA: outer membrane protein assembly factor BamD [Gemmatimonadaceae bacterium]|jgi:outer membrane protein assembly factor BamD
MIRSRALALTFLLLSGCRATFNAASYDVDTLFRVAMREYNTKHWDNAAKAFERLTTELPARDPRVPIAYFYLGKSQDKTGDRLLAAKSYARINELFPQDTLADDGLFYSGLAYQSLWRKPVLDAEYGENALTQYQTLLGLYPDSPLAPKVNEQIARLDQWFATKDYETGYHYLKRKAYDSAIIYFKDVIRLHPTAPKAREAYLRLHQAYRAINYRDDARDLCDAMRKSYPTDRDVLRECGPGTTAASNK